MPTAAQPSFDDERTLLSARRVVPLAKIDAKERNRRHWLLGGAFALAMMLGAASALVASYLKLRNVSSTATSEITEVETPDVPLAVAAEPVNGGVALTEETAEVPEETEATEEAAAVTPTRAPRRATINRTTDLVRPRVVREIDEDAELERIRESIMVDAWEERRARRAARRERRERRNRVDHHDRDLSNLDEIFEGRRRRVPY